MDDRSSAIDGPENIKVTIEVWEVGGCIQLSIGQEDAKGNGHGYRLGGPSFAGNSTRLYRKVLDERDAQEIRSYLDRMEGEQHEES